MTLFRRFAWVASNSQPWQQRRGFGKSRSVKVFCNSCRTHLYKYRKRGKGALVKCFEERIEKDYTNKDLRCPKCGVEFARLIHIRGKPAHKIIGSKVYSS